MRKVTGKQMKTVWREKEFPVGEEEMPLIWTLSAPSNGEKSFGKHPTQKPVALVERCLLASTNKNNLVLDPFLGGGTTAVACVRLKRSCIGIELNFNHLTLAVKRADREIIELWLREFRVRFAATIFLPNDLDLFSETINGSRSMDDKPQVPTERIYHKCDFVFLSCAQVERGAVVHTTVDVSLQEAWAKTPNGKKRETTHIVRTPNLVLLHYQKPQWTVRNLFLVPHFAFAESSIEKRNPLRDTAERHGHVLCNIVLKNIPSDAKIPLITNGAVSSPAKVREHFKRLQPLKEIGVKQRGWTLDVLNAIRRLGKTEFTTTDTYVLIRELEKLHPDNHRVREKIRQQLQVLRERNLLLHVDRNRWRLP